MSEELELLCDCGYLARAANRADLIDDVRRHAAEVHAVNLSERQVVSLIEDEARGGGDGPGISPC